MSEFQKRVIEEKAALDQKIEALEDFSEGEIYAQLPDDEQNRLEDQHEAMDIYSDILGERIRNFPVDSNYAHQVFVTSGLAQRARHEDQAPPGGVGADRVRSEVRPIHDHHARPGIRRSDSQSAAAGADLGDALIFQQPKTGDYYVPYR